MVNKDVYNVQEYLLFRVLSCLCPIHTGITRNLNCSLVACVLQLANELHAFACLSVAGGVTQRGCYAFP